MSILAPMFATFLALSSATLPLVAPAVPAAAYRPAFAIESVMGSRSVDFGEAKSAARATYVEQLEEFAKWCQKKKALAQRNFAYEAILEIDPEHKTARKYLKYTYDRKAGEWIRKREYKAPKAGKPAVLEEALLKRAEVDAAHGSVLAATVTEHAEALGPVAAYDERVALLAFAPDDGDLRAAVEHVKVEIEGVETWMSKEAAMAAERRAEFIEAISAKRKSAPKAKTGELNKTESGWGVKWAAPLLGKRARVVASRKLKEREDLLRDIEILLELAPKMTGKKLPSSEGITVYLVEGTATVPDIVDKAVSEESSWRDPLIEHPEDHDHVWLSDEHLLCFDRVPTERLDAALNAIAGRVAGESGNHHGWAGLAIGHYVTELMLGTREAAPSGARFADTSTGAEEDGDVADPKSDWLKIAQRVLTELDDYSLADAIDCDYFKLNGDDLVVGYAFTRFLIEGNGAAMTKKVVAGTEKLGEESSKEMIEKAFGIPFELVERRFRAWIAESVN